MNFATMKLTEIVMLPGVADLKGKQKMQFALALKKESEGLVDEAREALDKAIDAGE